MDYIFPVGTLTNTPILACANAGPDKQTCVTAFANNCLFERFDNGSRANVLLDASRRINGDGATAADED